MDATRKRNIAIGIACAVSAVVLVGTAFYFRKRSSPDSDDVVQTETSDNKKSSDNSESAKSVSAPSVSAGSTSRHSVTVSAPGKALVAGGYLVLTRPNLGVVISATARFYTTVALIPSETAGKSGEASIFVDSPQFHSTFQFNYSSATNQLKLASSTENKFVEKCLSVVFSFAHEHFGEAKFCQLLNDVAQRHTIGIRMQADNDFYSQTKALKTLDMPLLSPSLRTLPHFNVCPKLPDGTVEVAKTGMGSSAALTVSLVGGLLQWFGIVNIAESKSDADCALIHNLAQLAHGTPHLLY